MLVTNDLISILIVNWMKNSMRRFSTSPVRNNVQGEGVVWGKVRGEKGKGEVGRGHWAWSRCKHVTVTCPFMNGTKKMRSLPRIIPLVVFLIGFGISGAFAQGPKIGDYQSVNSGNWSDLTSWERFNGTNWQIPTIEQGYPGQSTVKYAVTIQDGHVVTINVSPVYSIFSLRIGEGISGILQYEEWAACTLMVNDIIRINPGGTFRSSLTGTVTTHELILAGSIVNEGTLNFSTNTNTAGVGIIFTGAENEVFDLSDATFTNLRAGNGLVLNKGTSTTSILWFIPGEPFQVLSGNSPTEGFLTITSGTFGIIGLETFNNPLFYATTGNYTIPPNGGFLLDNPNATIVGMYGTLINDGEVIIRRGTYNIGTGTGNESVTNSSGRFEMSGGNLNISGRFRIDGGDCILTGGTMNLATIGHADRTRAAFYASPSADITIRGDPLITFAYPNSNSTPSNDIEILEGTGNKIITSGTFQMGTAATPAYRTFLVNSEIPVHNLLIYNAKTRVSLTGDLAINNQLTLNGRLLMNNYNLDIGDNVLAGTFGVDDGMIVTGIGEVRKVIVTGGSYLFPLGDEVSLTRYLPVNLDFTSGTFIPGATVAVSMVRYKHPRNANTTNFLKRYWTVRTTGITNPVYDFTGSYLNGDIPPDQEAYMTIGIYTTAWEKLHPPIHLTNTIIVSGLRGDVDLSGINAAAPVVKIIPVSASICSGTSVQLTALATGDGNLTYSWTPIKGFSATIIVNPIANPTTTYTVTVRDGNGESVSASVTVTVNPLPVIPIIYHN